MSVLKDKRVLIVGEENNQIHDIVTALEKEGANVESVSCDDFGAEYLESNNIDVVFLNHLHKEGYCSHMLASVQKSKNTRVIPVFVLVNDRTSEIQDVLECGAADYFTPSETVASIVHKARIVLGESINAAGGQVIDLEEPAIDLEQAGVRVLIVEDDPLLSNLLSIRFDKASFPYRVNSDGKNIINDLKNFNPDVVILDLMLPGCSGFDVLREIRENSESKSVPVFIFSNRDSAEDKARAIELGASGFFVKAMTDLSELINNITKVVKSSSV